MRTQNFSLILRALMTMWRSCEFARGQSAERCGTAVSPRFERRKGDRVSASNWQPRVAFGMLREMARTFGSIVTRSRDGKTRFGLRFRIDGEEFHSWSVPVGERKIRYSSRDLAEGVLDEIRSDIRRGIDPLAAVSPYLQNSTLFAFEKFWDEWTGRQRERAAAGQLNPTRARNVSSYARLGHLDPILGVSVFDLNFGFMEGLQQHLLSEQRLSPKSTRHILTDVKTCLRWLARRKGFPAAPDIPPTAVPRHIPTIPSIEEQRAMLDAIPWNQRGYFLARGLLGVRDEEAARANLEDYRWGNDESADSWFIRAKAGQNRLVPVPAELARWVREHHRPGPCEVGTPLFTNPESIGPRSDNGRWSPSARRRAMLKAMEQIGRPKAWRPNEALRHCFGTRTAERLLCEGQGEHDAIRMVMSIMGHTSDATSRRYVHLAVEVLRDAVK